MTLHPAAVFLGGLVVILFILGLSAAIRPLPLELQSVRLDVPVMIAAAIALFVMALDGVLNRTEELLLVVAGIAYAAAVSTIKDDRDASSR